MSEEIVIPREKKLREEEEKFREKQEKFREKQEKFREDFREKQEKFYNNLVDSFPNSRIAKNSIISIIVKSEIESNINFKNAIYKLLSRDLVGDKARKLFDLPLLIESKGD